MEKISWPLITSLIKKYDLDEDDFDHLFYTLIDNVFLGEGNVEVEEEARRMAFNRQLNELLK